MRIRKKKWVAPYIENEDRYIIKRADQINKTKDRLYAEIGMGMGDFITKSASLNPDILYIGLEKEATCVAKAAIKASEYDLDNLGIIFDGADNIEAYFDHNIDRIYLHFSDPWPKKAHAKRRLTYHTFLAKYKQVLKADGEIIFKTDNAGLFEFSIIEFLNNGFTLLEISVDYHREPKDDIMTAYESKFVELSKPIYFARLKNKV